MQTTAQQLKLIIFELNKEEYSIPVQQVRSIEKLLPITRVPNVPAHIKGVINLRGVITPIVDLRTRFDFPQKQYDERTRIIITAVGEIEVGFIVDAANDVLDIQEESIEPAPEIVGSVETKYVQGVVKIDRRLFVCLDLHEVLQLESIYD